MSDTLPFLLVGVAFVAGGAFFVVAATRTRRRTRDFVARAVITPAQVIDLRQTWLPHNNNSADGPDQPIFRPVVRFGLPDGKTVEAATRWGTNPPPAQVGQQVEVRYDPADPTHVDLAHRSGAGTASCLMVGLGIGLALFGLVFIAIWYLVVQVLP